jgi:hypothetical protein
MNQGDRIRRLEVFDKVFGQHLDKRLQEEKSIFKTTLSENFDRQILLAEEYAKSEDYPAAWLHRQIADKIYEILKDLCLTSYIFF